MIGPVPGIWGGLNSGGGVASHVRGLVSVLPEQNIRVSLMADNTDDSKPLKIPALNGNLTPYQMLRPKMPWMLGEIFQLGWIRICRIVFKTFFQSSLRRSAPFSNQMKFVIQGANFDRFLLNTSHPILHVHHAEYRQYICQELLKVCKPIVATVHGVSAVVNGGPDWLVKMIRVNYQRASRLIAVSNYVKEVIVRQGADPDKITVIPNGVDVDTFSPAETGWIRDRLKLSRESNIILFVGSLKSTKGVDVLLRALNRCVSKHIRLRLIIIGTGREQKNLEAMARHLGIRDRVTFAGDIPHNEMPLWYRACDIFTLPSYAEGFGIAALEAMACEKAVVVSQPPFGSHDAVKHEKTGLLVDYGNVDQLAGALDRLISGPELTRSLGIAARKAAKQKFSWRTVGSETAQVYRNLLLECDPA